MFVFSRAGTPFASRADSITDIKHACKIGHMHRIKVQALPTGAMVLVSNVSARKAARIIKDDWRHHRLGWTMWGPFKAPRQTGKAVKKAPTIIDPMTDPRCNRPVVQLLDDQDTFTPIDPVTDNVDTYVVGQLLGNQGRG